jgi:hypothetical protein
MRFLFVPLLACLAGVSAAADNLELTVELTNGTSDCPMMVVWAVDGSGKFVKTLHWFSKDKKYMKDLTAWTKSRAGSEERDDLDGVIGPTIKWNGTQTATIPVKSGDINLLDGSYTLRIEQRKDKAGHYKSTKIPLGADFSGTTLGETGYIKNLTVTVK